MSLTIRIRPLAQGELTAAVAWYESARPGLGRKFGAAVYTTLEAVADTPLRHAIVEGDVREAVVAGYPYCAYFRVRRSDLIVLAIYHQKRDPSGWQGRA